jgi:hypothetical protein
MLFMVRREEGRRVQKRAVKSARSRVEEEDPRTDEDTEEVSEVEVVSEDEESYEEGTEEEAPAEEEEAAEEEEPAEEEEAAEEEVAARPRRRAKKPSGKGNALKIAAIVIVVIIIVGIVAAMFLVQRPPTAKFTVSPDPNTLQAGTVITFDASGSSGANSITKYAWEFGDGDTAEGKTVTHTYLHKGGFTANLTVTDSKGLTGKASQQMTVVGTLVTVPKAMIGDTVAYDISGYVDMANPDGFWTYTSTITIGFVKVTVVAKVTDAHIVIDTSKKHEMTVDNSLGTGVEDGYGELHSCVQGKTTQTMSFSGYAIVKLYPANGAATQTLNQSVSGNANANEQACSDLDTNTTVKTARNDQYTVRLGTSSGTAPYTKSGSDTVTSYPKKRQEFNVNDLRDNRTFRTGDSGEHTFGSTTFQWEVVNDEVIGTYPTLQIHITMDDASMAKNGFTTFDMDVWISSSFSAPLKTHLRTEGTQNGNRVLMDVTATYTSFSMGSQAIPFGTCTANTPDGHFYKHRPGIEYAAPDTYGPAMGTNDPSLTAYTLPDAVAYAKAHSSGLQSYLGANSGAFLVDAYYNDSGGTPRWNLTFGEKDSTSAYNTIVTQSSVTSQGNVKISTVGLSIKSYSSALTFAAAEQVFKSQSSIKAKVYSGDAINTQKYNFGSKAGVPLPEPTVPINTNVLSATTEYFFYVESFDHSYSAGVDAETGQIFYIKY